MLSRVSVASTALSHVHAVAASSPITLTEIAAVHDEIVAPLSEAMVDSTFTEEQQLT